MIDFIKDHEDPKVLRNFVVMSPCMVYPFGGDSVQFSTLTIVYLFRPPNENLIKAIAHPFP
jgi:hypothetical protein